MKQDAVMAVGVGAIFTTDGITADWISMICLVIVIVAMIRSSMVVIVVVVLRVEMDTGGGHQHEDNRTGDRSGANQLADQWKHVGRIGHVREAVKRHRESSPLTR